MTNAELIMRQYELLEMVNELLEKKIIKENNDQEIHNR